MYIIFNYFRKLKERDLQRLRSRPGSKNLLYVDPVRNFEFSPLRSAKITNFALELRFEKAIIIRVRSSNRFPPRFAVYCNCDARVYETYIVQILYTTKYYLRNVSSCSFRNERNNIELLETISR